MTNLNYYKVLRLSPTATPKEVQKAFIELSILFDDSKDSLTQEIMEIIREAFSVLREPDTRARYDLQSMITRTNDEQNTEFTDAEKIIYSWQMNYSVEEQEYIDKIHFINRIVKIIISIGALIFLWLVITNRIDIAFLVVFALFFTSVILRSIYIIKNPPPPPEVWGVQ